MKKKIAYALSTLAAFLLALAALAACSAHINAEKIDAGASISNPIKLEDI